MPTPLEEIRGEFLAFKSDVQALASRWVHLMDKVEAALEFDKGMAAIIPKQGGAMVERATHLCPLCSAPMRKRTGYRGEFWGCTNYPDCEGTRDIDGRNSSRVGCKRLKPPAKSTTPAPQPDTSVADDQVARFVRSSEEDDDVPF